MSIYEEKKRRKEKQYHTGANLKKQRERDSGIVAKKWTEYFEEEKEAVTYSFISLISSRLLLSS